MGVKAIALRVTNDKGYASGVGKNSANIDNNELLKDTAGTGVEAATAGDTIVGISVTDKTFDSDNFTVDRDRVSYTPTDSLDRVLLPVRGAYTITFDAALVASNTINMTVNGTAMTEVTYATSNDNTLDLIAAQLVTDFPTLISAAVRKATRIVHITPKEGVTLTIASIVVAAGASQANGAAAQPFDAADEGKFYDIDTVWVDVYTEHASSGQVKLTKYVSATKSWFAVVNT